MTGLVEFVRVTARTQVDLVALKDPPKEEEGSVPPASPLPPPQVGGLDDELKLVRQMISLPLIQPHVYTTVPLPHPSPPDPP